jgi:hypothetical protein
MKNAADYLALVDALIVERFQRYERFERLQANSILNY